MSNKTILIVAHEDNSRRSLADVFFEEEYAVSTASSGEEGLEMLMKEQPSVAIIDQGLWEMDGMRTLSRFKEIRPETQVIMLTGHGTIDTAFAAAKMGAFAYIVKPPELAHLVNTVKRALDATKSS